MSRGFSQGINSAPFIPSSNSPFAAGAAENGLSVDTVTGKIVLGQDVGDPLNPAVLLSTREIPLAGNDLNLNNAIDAGLGVPAQQGNVFVNLLFAPPGGSYAFTVRGARNDGISDALEFTVTKHGLRCTDDVNGAPINVLQADNTALTSDNGLSLIPPIYSVGDVNNVSNGTKTVIDDLQQLFDVRDILANRFLSIDIANKVYTMGDVDGVNTNSRVGINEPLFLAFLAANDGLGGNSGLNAQADTVGSLVFSQLAASDPVNNLQWFLDASQNRVDLIHNSNTFLMLDFVNTIYGIGDIAGVNNGAHLSIDDTTGIFTIDNTAHTAAVNINGVAGFTGTVAPVNTITVVGGIVTNVA